MDFSSFTYFSNILCAVKLKVLGLKAYWHAGSANFNHRMNVGIVKTDYDICEQDSKHNYI